MNVLCLTVYVILYCCDCFTCLNDMLTTSKHCDENEMNSQNRSSSVETEPNSSPVEESVEPEVDITISNVVSNFSVKCHLNLRQIATNGANVVYRREQSMISMKLRDPRVTASIWSSGKITCTGATTEVMAKLASRRVARTLQKMGFKVKFGSYRIVNVLGSCILPFGIKIHEFSSDNRRDASYEPELHPGATYRMKDIKAVLKIFQTGAITITAPSIPNIQIAVERIYPLVYEYRKPKPQNKLPKKLNNINIIKQKKTTSRNIDDDFIASESECYEEESDSECDSDDHNDDDDDDE